MNRCRDCLGRRRPEAMDLADARPSIAVVAPELGRPMPLTAAVAVLLSVLAGACASLAPSEADEVPDGASGGLCVPTSAPADECSSDSDCDGVGASCEPRAHVCLVRCPSLVISSPEALRAARRCREIDGKYIEPNIKCESAIRQQVHTIGLKGVVHIRTL
jgi:hypothetical protein